MDGAAPSDPSPRLKRQEDQRRRILDAAIRCFSRGGFHATGMQAVCAEAGMSPGALYRYFPSKEAIIEAIVERDRADIPAQLAPLLEAEDVVGALIELAAPVPRRQPAARKACRCSRSCSPRRSAIPRCAKSPCAATRWSATSSCASLERGMALGQIDPRSTPARRCAS